MTAYTPDVVRTIIRNAGRMPPEEIARDCGVSLNLVERVAREQGVDLRIPRERLENDTYRPSAAGRRACRDVQVTIHLQPADIDEIMAAGAVVGLTRNAAIRRLIENARAKYLIEALVRLPAPARRNGEGGA